MPKMCTNFCFLKPQTIPKVRILKINRTLKVRMFVRTECLLLKMTQKDKLINYYCSTEFIDLYLGNFRITDRPKRMIFRFLSEENLECLTTSSPIKLQKPLDSFNKCNTSSCSIKTTDQLKKKLRPKKVKSKFMSSANPKKGKDRIWAK